MQAPTSSLLAMFAQFERRPAFCSYSIRSIDWKGTPGQTDGWLASGNAKGLVGLTYTTEEIVPTLADSQGDEEATPRASLPSRTNFNLREHTTDVILKVALFCIILFIVCPCVIGNSCAVEQIAATPSTDDMR